MQGIRDGNQAGGVCANPVAGSSIARRSQKPDSMSTVARDHVSCACRGAACHGLCRAAVKQHATAHIRKRRQPGGIQADPVPAETVLRTTDLHTDPRVA